MKSWISSFTFLVPHLLGALPPFSVFLPQGMDTNLSDPLSTLATPPLQSFFPLDFHCKEKEPAPFLSVSFPVFLSCQTLPLEQCFFFFLSFFSSISCSSSVIPILSLFRSSYPGNSLSQFPLCLYLPVLPVYYWILSWF